MSLVDKLSHLLGTKVAIKEAIQEKGKEVPENATFRDFANLIKGIITVDNQEKSVTITGNGTTTVVPDTSKTGLSKVTVNTNVNTVKNQAKTQNITGNGTVTVKPDSGYTGFSQVTINTNVNRYNGPTAIAPLIAEVSGGSINKTITWTIPANKNVMIVLVNVNKGSGTAVCKVNSTVVSATSVYDKSSDGVRTQIWRWLISASSSNRTLSLTGESGAGRMCSAFAIY